MADIIEELRNKIIAEFDGVTSQSFTEPVLAFVHAIDWTEKWLLGLLAFQSLLLAFVIKTRKKTGVQMTTFLLAMAAIFFAERLNTFLGRHWESFAGQNYFDKHGVFISTLWSGPLLVISLLILVNSLLMLVSLMVQWKRAELKYRARVAQQKSK